MNALCTQLLESNKNGPRMKEPSPIPNKGLDIGHEHVQKESLGRCEWGKLHSPGCPRKRAFKKRKFGTNITEAATNDASEAILRGSRTRYKCSKCQIWLCREGQCWQRYHHLIGVNI
jgi:hypothetical protein